MGSATEALQFDYWNFTQGWTAVVTGQTALTGAIRFQAPDGVHYSCGATFISPRYALTAAHCVDERSLPPGNTFRVEQYNTTNVNALHLINQAYVSGTWPNYTRTPLPNPPYSVTSYTGCVPVVGCMFGELDRNCPFGEDVDIALIHCPTRPKTAGYASVHPSDSSNAQIEVSWFHEFLLLDTDPNSVLPSAPSDNWPHYGQWQNNRLQNYHYSTGSHQMIPLRSANWPSGAAYRQFGHVAGLPSATQADVPVCHGTSGSGVFERGTTGMFGVVTNFGFQTKASHQAPDGTGIGDRLCEDMISGSNSQAVAPQQSLMLHSRRWHAAQLEALSMVQLDRQP